MLLNKFINECKYCNTTEYMRYASERLDFLTDKYKNNEK